MFEEAYRVDTEAAVGVTAPERVDGGVGTAV
jgi:hypothetical protein